MYKQCRNCKYSRKLYGNYTCIHREMYGDCKKVYYCDLFEKKERAHK